MRDENYRNASSFPIIACKEETELTVAQKHYNNEDVSGLKYLSTRISLDCKETRIDLEGKMRDLRQVIKRHNIQFARVAGDISKMCYQIIKTVSGGKLTVLTRATVRKLKHF